jgi:hypothetical protein
MRQVLALLGTMMVAGCTHVAPKMEPETFFVPLDYPPESRVCVEKLDVNRWRCIKVRDLRDLLRELGRAEQ